MKVAPSKIECENRGGALNAVITVADVSSNPFVSHSFNIFNYFSFDISIKHANCGAWESNGAVRTFLLDKSADPMAIDNLGTDDNCLDAIPGLNPISPVKCDGLISDKNRGSRAEKSSSFITVLAFYSPAEKTPGPHSDLSGMRDLTFMTPIRDGFSADFGSDHCPEPLVSRPFSSSIHKPVIRVFPSGFRFSVLASPKNSPLPHSSPRDLDCVLSLSPTSVSLVPDEGWQVITRKVGKSPLLQLCSHAGRCFKCGL